MKGAKVHDYIWAHFEKFIQKRKLLKLVSFWKHRDVAVTPWLSYIDEENVIDDITWW